MSTNRQDLRSFEDTSKLNQAKIASNPKGVVSQGARDRASDDRGRAGLHRRAKSSGERTQVRSDALCSCSLFLNHSRMPKGCATSMLHFPPPAICGCDGSKLAQFSPQYQRTRHKEGVFRYCLTERSIEKGVAEIGPLGFVFASERRVVSICGGDDVYYISETRYEDARIASRNDHDLISHPRAATSGDGMA